MTIKCKAAILRQTGAEEPYEKSQPISIEEITLDPPKAGDVVVKVAGAGLCHSDLSVINGNRPRPVPLALGHEGAGEIVEVGAGVKDVKVGDHIAFQFSASCGRCARCQAGRPQLCEQVVYARAHGELMTGGKRIHDADGHEISHHSGVSCFSQYSVVDRGSVVVVDKSISLEDAALFGCAVMTGVGAVINTARIRVGETVAVIGLGGVGLNGVIGAALAGAEKIIAIDLLDSKLEKARTLGATHTVNASDPDCIEKILEMTNGGVDFAIELAGSIPAMDLAYAILCRGGSVITAGLSPAGAQFKFEHANLVSEEKSIRGSYMGSCVPVRDIPRFIEFYKQGRLPIDQLIDGKLGFDGLNAGFDLLQSGKVVRQILLPND